MESTLATLSGANADLLAALRDPAALGYPPMLPVEIALKIDTPAKICEIYGISKERFVKIIADPVFIKSYQEAV